MRGLLRFLVIVTALPAVWGLSVGLVSMFTENAAVLAGGAFGIGFIGYLAVYVVFLRERMGFLEVFEHELGHAVVAAILLRPVELFFSLPVFGVVGYRGERNSLITLAPYFLPVFTLPLLLVRPFVTEPAGIVVDGLIGVTLGFHIAGLFREFRPNQPDISETGLVYSLALTSTLNLSILALVVHVVLGVPGKYAAFLWEAGERMAGFGGDILTGMGLR